MCSCNIQSSKSLPNMLLSAIHMVLRQWNSGIPLRDSKSAKMLAADEIYVTCTQTSCWSNSLTIA